MSRHTPYKRTHRHSRLACERTRPPAISNSNLRPTPSPSIVLSPFLDQGRLRFNLGRLSPAPWLRITAPTHDASVYNRSSLSFLWCHFLSDNSGNLEHALCSAHLWSANHGLIGGGFGRTSICSNPWQGLVKHCPTIFRCTSCHATKSRMISGRCNLSSDSRQIETRLMSPQHGVLFVL